MSGSAEPRLRLAPPGYEGPEGPEAGAGVNGEAAAPGAGPTVPCSLGPAELARLSELQVLRRLATGPRGLLEAEAERRLLALGGNQLPGPAPRSRLAAMAVALRDPFTVTLMLLAAVTMVAGSLDSALVLAALTCAAAGVRFVGEHAAGREAALPHALSAGTATVVRRSQEGARPVARELPFDEFVPGDVVRLAAGDRLPADVLLLSAEGLTLDQSVLTGESLPVPRRPGGWAQPASARAGHRGGGHDLLAEPRLCLRGSWVTHGSGVGVVVATGADCRLAGDGRYAVPAPRSTRFDRSARSVAKLLLALTLLSAAAAVGVELVIDADGWEVLPYAGAVAVGLTPEMLALVVTTILARTARRVRAGSVRVQRLSAVHDLGALDVLCADKTGTLTRDRLRLVRSLGPGGAADAEPARWAALGSLVTLELGDPPLLDAVDEALLDAAFDAAPDFGERVTGVEVFPFDPVRRLAGAVLREPGRLGRRTVVVKGAVEEVLQRCSHERSVDGELPLDAARRTQLLSLAEESAATGQRVLAVARGVAGKGLPESGLTLLGLVGLAEEADPDAAEALARLSAEGVAVKIVTGDRPGAALHACREAGLAPGVPLLGREIDALDEEALGRAATATTVFALANPAQKARVVHALRAQGHCVGFLGDGANDLPALHAADIGLGAPAATETPRDRADLLLTGPGLRGLPEAVRAARNGLANLGAYVRISVASNLGNVLAMLVAGLTLPFLPMLPSQVLVQNLCFDAAQLSLAFDRPTAPGTERPPLLDARGLARFVLLFGAVNACADLLTFLLLHRIGAGGHSLASQRLFHSGWFTENLVTQALTVHVLRSPASGVRVPAARPVRWANLGLVAVGVLLPLSPAGAALALGPLPLVFYPLLALVLALYGGALLLARRRLGGWLRRRPGRRPLFRSHRVTC